MSVMNRVTITGADDRTPISALIDLSAEFPFVEWAILVSKAQAGGTRFPAFNWCERFASAVYTSSQTIDVSMHVCGKWVRELLVGDMQLRDLPEVKSVAKRLQINTHAEAHMSTVAGLEWIDTNPQYQYIFQLDEVNDHLLDAAKWRGIDAAGLFDCSHGAGILPASWPSPNEDPCGYQRLAEGGSVYYGYAGGLGPLNVVGEIHRIKQAFAKTCDNTEDAFWIDMEGQVRTDEVFDLAKVRAVLELCAFDAGGKL